MSIRSIYRDVTGWASTRAFAARSALFRGLFYPEFQRQEREDEALASLRALGDDGTHLQQAVALAAIAAPDEAVDRLIRQIARGDEQP